MSPRPDELRSLRRRVTYWHYGVLAMGGAPMFVLLFLPELLGREELFPNLEGGLGALPYGASLLWLFISIFLASTTWKWFGLRCQDCQTSLYDEVKFEQAMTTGRCGGCHQPIALSARGSRTSGERVFDRAPVNPQVTLMSRQEFARLQKAASNRFEMLRWAWMIPMLAYVGVLIGTGKTPFYALGEVADGVLSIAVVVAYIGLLLYLDRKAWKGSGLLCGSCGHKFGGPSFEITMTSGRCGGCGAKVLSDAPAGSA